jgi:GNAT superfamily N-acetyltransferase
MTPEARQVGDTVRVTRPVWIRSARKADLPLIEDVFLASARQGWRGMFGEERLKELRRDGLPEWDMEGVSVLVAARESQVVGFSSFGPAYGEDDPPSVGKLYRLFVLPHMSGAGVGSSLLASSVERLLQAGFTAAVLWVGEGNTEARRFYERRGWKPDGTRRSREFLAVSYSEIRYRADLSLSGP